MNSYAALSGKPDSASLDDSSLVRAARRGDSRAFGTLYDRYVEQIYRYIYFRVASQADAEDLTQRLFLRLLEAIRNARENIDEFKPYLYRSAHNLVIDHYRHKQAFPDSSEPTSLEDGAEISDFTEHPDEQIIRHEQHARIAGAVAKLEETAQQVITCRFVNSLSCLETAYVLGLTESHVRVIQFRALKKLREMVGIEEEDYA